MKIRKSKIANIAYWVAVVALLASAGWYVINREFDLVIQIGLILTGLCIILAVAIDPERVWKALKGRQARYGSNALIFTLAFLGILSVINFLIYKNPVRWDLTEDKLYSLSPETLRILDELPDDVMIRGFYTPSYSSARENIRPLLDQYRVNSDNKLDFEFIDPEESPFVAQQYNVIRDGSLVVTLGEDSEVVEYASEEKITEALLRVINPQERKVYFLTGHGEREIEIYEDYGFSQVSRSLISKNYYVGTLNLLVEGSIPEDATVLLTAGPMATLLEDEINLISDYIDQGGAFVVLFEPLGRTQEEHEADPLISYLKTRWGIDPLNNFVIDTSTNFPYYAFSSVPYTSHPITEELGNLVSYFPTVRSLKTLDLEETSILRTEIVFTGDRSWGETDFEAIQNQMSLDYNEDIEELGPLPLVISAEDESHDSRIVVFGDSDFASNAYFFDLGNGDLLLNSIDWAAGEEQLISLTPKETTARYVLPPSTQVTGIVFLITIILIPGIVIVMGVTTWWQRRKRS
jgi:ABC-type uncharacterized transport system involved in gliding motility auxiliary subunit